MSKRYKIRFTEHAKAKFDLLRRYGFLVSEKQVIETILNAARSDHKDNQLLATRALDGRYALKVVYRLMNGNITVITFYPVKRSRLRV